MAPVPSIGSTTVLMAFMSVAVPMITACVPPQCVYVTGRSDNEWDLNNGWLISIIALSCALFLAIIIILIWFCCYFCYRDNVAMAPRVVRRVIRVKHPAEKEVVCRKERVMHVLTPPPQLPPPVLPSYQPPPSEPVVIVPPPCPEPPQSLLLTVSEGMHAGNNGPGMTTLLDKPLTFTLTPQSDGVRNVGLRGVHDHVTIPGGQVDCSCRGHGCCAGCQF